MKSFDINSPVNEVGFDVGKEAPVERTVAFAVTNTSTRPVRGRAVARALQSAKIGWLSIQGDVERDFAPQEVHQFTVSIQIPKGTAPESYSFRLECVDPSNEDDYTEGPAVAIKVKEVEDGKPFPWWWIVAAGVGVVVIGTVLFFVLRPGGGLKMPDLVGDPLAAAQSTLAEMNLTNIQVVGRTTAAGDTLPENVSFPVPHGTVLETTPGAGRSVQEGDSIVLFVEERLITVPDLRGKFIWDVERILDNLGLKKEVTQIQNPNSALWGKVLSHTPVAQTQVQEGSTVTCRIWVQRRANNWILAIPREHFEVLRVNPELLRVNPQPPE